MTIEADTSIMSMQSSSTSPVRVHEDRRNDDDNNSNNDIKNPHDYSHQLSMWSGYFKKTLRERQDQLALFFPHVDADVLNGGGLDNNVADVMIENCVGKVALPLGIAPSFIVNGVHCVVPMAVEEPSVIAAASGAAKLVAKAGGFHATSSGNIMTGQVQLLDFPNDDFEAAAQRIRDARHQLITEANTYCVSMHKRGGGVIDVYPRIVLPRKNGRTKRFRGAVVVHVDIDVCEAMGANVVNTVVEGMASLLASVSLGRVALKILTNLCLKRITSASLNIPFSMLSWKGISGREVAERIVDAYEFAESDEFRAATHNKGIMNGIDAIAVACGQDWRAIESSAHAFAARRGYYGSLSSYTLTHNALTASISLPIAVGVKGGALHTHPSYAFSMGVLGSPSAETLSHIIACVGLAQNFAAVRALAVEGIQKGHMALHARNIAVAAGVPNALVAEVSAYLASRQKISQAAAKEYIAAHDLYTELYTRTSIIRQVPSSFFVELALKNLDEPLSLNVVLPTLSKAPVNIVFAGQSAHHPLQDKLLGEGKGIEWLTNVYTTLDTIKLHSKEPPRANQMLQTRLKIVSIVLNVLVDRLMFTHAQHTSTMLKRALDSDDRRELLLDMKTDDPVLAIGLPLILTLWQMFDYTVEQFVHESHPTLAHALCQEQRIIIACIVQRRMLMMRVDDNDDVIIDNFMSQHAKRWQATCILLCDAVAITPSSLTEQRIAFLRRLGEFFEYEAMFSHDVARFKRDITEGKTNVYASWLNARALVHSDEVFERFWNAVDRICSARRRIVCATEETESFFDSKLFMRTSNNIRQYYGVPAERLDDTPICSDSDDV